ncbi:hypothetical protein [Pseudomonas sp. NPDC096950]|uniref:hypothetical protein n=1 Tax=Pseudomonas sp. NPDC096950 TaxID=3364485 RepID=UPI00383BCA4F
MTGLEFKACLNDVGLTQLSFSKLMGVSNITINRLCKSERVENHWIYALAGYVASQATGSITALVSECV